MLCNKLNKEIVETVPTICIFYLQNEKMFYAFFDRPIEWRQHTIAVAS